MIEHYRLWALVALAVAMIAGCGAQPPVITLDASPQSHQSNAYGVLHSFGKGTDGEQPKAALINVNGTLYGTTFAGGSRACGNDGCGTVFTIQPTSGDERLLYKFTGGYDGASPSAGLLYEHGTLYGTTEYGGGEDDKGTAFKLTTGGVESILHRFGYDSEGHYSLYDGANPVASLISVKNKFYGTTYAGGMNKSGTIFRINVSGAEKVLHNFVSYYDGTNPTAALLYVKGNFYGTTQIGPGTEGFNTGYGTVFSMSSAGAETVLFTFYPEPYGSDGDGLQAALVNVDGTLYSTTSQGGPNHGGTAFSITTAGYVTNLHNFGTGIDGSASYAPLLNVRGMLYGTTSAGGVYGKGTIFKLTFGGKEKVVHSFGYGSDGATPLAGLIDVNGTLYGTTSAGGAKGEGTVFALKL